MMFYPGKAAFRAGYVSNLDWDNANVGRYSAALGQSNKASGDNSTAFGYSSWAGGTFSTAFGYNSFASGSSSTAMGFNSTANGSKSTAMGDNTFASGTSSTSMGFQNTTRGFASTVVGLYNDPVLSANELIVSTNTPLFMVGNGDDNINRSNALMVRKDGNVGIGNSDPEYLLDISNRIRLRGGGTGATSPGIWLNNVSNTGQVGFIGVFNDEYFGMYGSGGASWNLLMNKTNGFIGIGNQNPSQKLHVSGNICYTGTIAACSDMRFKKNFSPLTDALASVLNLQGIFYNWDAQKFPDRDFGDERQIGFLAQEIEKYFPEIVQTDKEGYKAVDYGRLTPVLVEAIKEQQMQMEEKQKQMEEIKKENKELKLRLEKLEKIILNL